MADVDVEKTAGPVDEIAADDAKVSPGRDMWRIRFLNGEDVTMVADSYQSQPQEQAIVLQADGQVVLTAPLANVLFVQKVIDG